MTGNLFFANFTQKMNPPTPTAPPTTLANLGTPPPAYQRLQNQLRQTSWICQGTVVARALRRRIRGRIALLLVDL